MIDPHARRPGAIGVSLAVVACVAAAQWAHAQDGPVLVPPTRGALPNSAFKPPEETVERAKLRYGVADAVSPVAPESHRAPRFLTGHGIEVRIDQAACVPCHSDDACAKCHNGQLRPATVHGPGFIGFHAVDAQRDPARCASCHTTQTFCRDCHLSARLGSTGAARPRPGRRHHPPGWVGDSTGAGGHARQARLTLPSCTSCHAQKDCTACHAAINPHPSDFTQRCRPLYKRARRMCETCHLPGDPVVAAACR